jgi:hypothetical protein
MPSLAENQIAGGAYVPTLSVGMYAPLVTSGEQSGGAAEMPRNGASAPPDDNNKSVASQEEASKRA